MDVHHWEEGVGTQVARVVASVEGVMEDLHRIVCREKRVHYSHLRNTATW